MSSSTSLFHKPRNSTAYPSAAGPEEALGAVRIISEPGHLCLLEQGSSILSTWHSGPHTSAHALGNFWWEDFFGPPKAILPMTMAPGPTTGRTDKVCLTSC